MGVWLITIPTDIDPGLSLFGGFILGVIVAAVMSSKPAGDIEP